MSVLISDTECFPGFWCAGFKRVSDGKVAVLEKSDRCELDRTRLESIIRGHRCIGFNWRGYDMAMAWAAIRGWSNERLKELSDQIIVGHTPWWRVEDLLGFRFPQTDYIDLIEPQPNAIASLKTLNGRLHGRQMQDLPYDPGHWLSDAERDKVIAYMGNDLDATHLLYDALAEPLALREAISKDLKFDVRSKSDTQMGFAILKRRVEQATGERLGKPPSFAGRTFRYRPPDYIRFATPHLHGILDQVLLHDFVVKPNGKVDLPKFLVDARITLGGSTYQMGLGGLHSTEACRSVYSDETHVLYDADAGSYYPAIAINLGLYPPAMGPVSVAVFRGTRDERIVAKRADQKSKADSLKIALNGGLFGNTMNPHSAAYSPPMGIGITLTGQLALLMLIEWAEAAGISAVSGNTDGATFLIPRDQANPIDGVRLAAWPADRDISFSRTLKEITDQWEQETGFDLEFVEYASLHNRSVNDYFAIKPDGKAKRKGKLGDWWSEKAMRDILMHNPNMTVCSNAALAFIQHGTPVEQTIRACDDIRQFVTVVNVRGGGTWRGEYLGKVARFIWSTDGDPILYKVPHPTTGNFKKVSKTDGARPMMRLEDTIPFDLDFARYVEEATEILRDVGVLDPLPAPVKVKAPTKAERAEMIQALRLLLVAA